MPADDACRIGPLCEPAENHRVDFAPDLILIFQAEQEKAFARCARKNATTPFAESLRTIETCHVGELYWQATGRRRSPSRKWPRIVWYSTRGSMRHFHRRMAGVLAVTVALGACVAPPVAPTIPVVPGPNKQFSSFAADQAMCQQYAAGQTAPQAYAATNQAVGGAILSTALGAALGAAIGGGRGAAIGAASGATFGTVVGAGGAGYAQMSLQQQYDVMYGQCMAAQGNQVPGFSPPGTPPYAGTPGPAPYEPGPSPYGPGPSPYGPGPSPYGPGPSPYGPPQYPGMPVPPPG